MRCKREISSKRSRSYRACDIGGPGRLARVAASHEAPATSNKPPATTDQPPITKMFSNRLPPDLEPNRLSRALERMRREGRAIDDLTASNPTNAGFAYPPDLLAPLAGPGVVTYDPAPSGSFAARSAIAGDYARRGLTVSPDRIVLTASTSEAYSVLFKLLA